MPYKVVQTMEKGKPRLWLVPDKWELNGILYWPKWESEKHLASEHSYPDDSWLPTKCMLKRTGLVSKSGAELELSQILEINGLDESIQQGMSSRRNMNAQKSFDELVKSCLTAEKTEPFFVSVENASTSQNQFIHVSSESEPVENLQPNPGPKAAQCHCDQSKKMDTVLSKLETLRGNQSVLFDHLQTLEIKVMQKLSQISSQINSYTDLSIEQGENSIPRFNILSSKADLDAFEENLKFPAFMADTKKQLSVICGKRNGAALTNAYTLADAMFSRQFLTLCSWTGGSRTDYSKTCFKVYSRIIRLFFELVYDTDDSFTMTQCHHFFKTIMRNSKNRSKGGMRASAPKHRAKRGSINRSNRPADNITYDDQSDSQFNDN